MKAFAVLLATVAVIGHVAGGPVVTPSLTKAYGAKDKVDIMIVMKEKTSKVLDQINSQNFINTDSKATALYNELNRFTSASQKEVLSILSQFKSVKPKGFYITNRISVQNAPLELVNSLLEREDIEEIREAKVAHIGRVIESVEPKVLEWGVAKINAPAAWDAGVTGAGVVVSSIDTGVRYTHVALRDGYRADYGWFDPYQMTATPNDQNGHGTHTMGTIAGHNGTGVAPGSKWIACKGCSTSSCTEDALIGCGQWTLCPTLPDGSAADCSKRPALSSNSWGGGTEDPWFDDIVNSWNSVNIIPIFAIGNSGPGCRSANSPGDRPNLISVGATNAQDLVASFSSHGPSATALRIKPEVSAPGVNVRSCGYLTDNAYSFLSGTSMACPHVAGAAALLIESGLTTRTEIATALEENAFRPGLDSVVCTGGGVDPDDPWPNNSYGWGRIDIWASLSAGKKA